MLIQSTSDPAAIEALMHAAPAKRLFSRWRAMRASGDLPPGEAFRVPLLGDATDFVMILAPLDDTFHYTYFGRGIVEKTGYDMTDRTVRDLGTDMSGCFAPQYQHAHKHRVPVYFTFRSHLTSEVHRWERLVLPVTHGSDGVRLIVFTKPVFLMGDLLNSVFAATNDGIIALSLISNEAGEPSDFMVELANESAAQKLECKTQELHRSILSRFIENSSLSILLRHCLDVYRTNKRETLEVADVGSEKKVFKVSINPMPNGLVLSLSDITREVEIRDQLERQRDEMRFTTETIEERASELASLIEELEAARNQLADEMRQREIMEAELRVMAETDPLTTLFNRRRFFDQADSEFVRARRHKSDLSLAVIDIDHFKLINDTRGHAFGDCVLLGVADRLRDVLRDRVDVIGRIGGEEFAILMPNTSLRDAQRVAERVRDSLSMLTIGKGDEAEAFSLTASIGIATLGADVTIDALYHRADCALYAAKNAGRDQVALSTDGSAEAA